MRCQTGCFIDQNQVFGANIWQVKSDVTASMMLGNTILQIVESNCRMAT